MNGCKRPDRLSIRRFLSIALLLPPAILLLNFVILFANAYREIEQAGPAAPIVEFKG